MTYSEKLRSPLWQKKRLEILQRDNWKCCVCQSTTKTLQVHHLFYARLDPWDYPNEAYQTLCEECHEQRQKLVDPQIEKLRQMMGSVPTDDLEWVLGCVNRLVEEMLKPMYSPIVVDPGVGKDQSVNLFEAMRQAAGVAND